MDFSLLLSSYATVWSNPEVLLMTFIGALGGVLLGAIPGMTATMGVALLIPFSFGMDLIPSIGLLLGIYCGGMYGGSISAILIHAPGTPAAAATLLDGYPMCKKGQAGKALSVAMFASFCGGVIGALVMTFLSPLVADMAMNFGPGEMFMLAVFGELEVGRREIGERLVVVAGDRDVDQHELHPGAEHRLVLRRRRTRLRRCTHLWSCAGGLEPHRQREEADGGREPEPRRQAGRHVITTRCAAPRASAGRARGPDRASRRAAPAATAPTCRSTA